VASPYACAALVDQFPHLARSKRALVGSHPGAATATLAAVVAVGPARVSEVAEQMGLDLSTVSRQVAHLRRDGLVQASPDASDGRSQRISATPAGVALLRGERRRLVDAVATRLTTWDDDDLGSLTRLLDRLADDLARTPPQPVAPHPVPAQTVSAQPAPATQTPRYA